MKAEYKDFIGVFSDVFSAGFCKHLIAEFERNRSLGAGRDRQTAEPNVLKHHKDDFVMHTTGNSIEFRPFDGVSSTLCFFEGLQNCFDEYAQEYSPVKSISMRCTNMKIQKTVPGGGYHVWHFEQGNGREANRGMAYMLYLNTLAVEENGETEFLYQQRRINPIENTMVLWPAGFTHTHRGNPVYGDSAKYIVTGWFYNE